MEQTRSTRILVTGGTGFVGSHLVQLLLAQGRTVRCLVRNPDRTRWLAGLGVELVQGDCTDPGSLPRALRGVSQVVHAAGLTKAKRTRDYYRVNHLGTRNILEACARYNPGITKFLLISSLAAAGPSPNGVPVQPGEPPRPVSDYGRSKLRAEEEALARKDAFPIVILRPSAVYGPRDRDMFELFRWACRGLTLEINGGERYINPCYVGDVASVIFRALEPDVPTGSIYFVAENRSYSWPEFRSTLLATGGVKAANIRIPYTAAYLIGLASEFASLFKTTPSIMSRQKVREAAERFWVCDTAATERELGIIHTPLEKGLQITWQWYREQNWL